MSDGRMPLTVIGVLACAYGFNWVIEYFVPDPPRDPHEGGGE